ncbi:MAG: ABC transporter ATP-binding protein [Candidatus Bathyarchaeia archaeon]
MSESIQKRHVNNMAILNVENLTTYYRTLRGYVKAAENVSFSLDKREAIGLAGESGCGKTTVALSILRLLPFNGEIVKGRVLFKGNDVVTMKESELRESIRWKGISLIFQGAMNALNPVYSVEYQIVEAIRTHEKNVSKREARDRVRKLFELVGLDPSRTTNYPHEFSGGMRQRAMIAMALACNPDVLIADEPGTALDVIVQAQVLKLLRSLKEKLNLGVIIITHDLSIISETCDKFAVMYAGKMVELGDVLTIFKEPLHPYTQGLILAFPNIKEPRRKMESIPGSPPNLLNPPSGCRFNPRCKYAMDKCKKDDPEFKEVSKGHFVACHLLG